MGEDLIHRIKIRDAQEAECILKAIDNDLEKAHVVGDMLYYNGKQYVYTEYKPGKFDWRIANKKKKIIRGDGFKGEHGFKGLQKAYSEIDDSFTDKSKMLLKRTPNGNWRLYYDNNDSGFSISGDAFTQMELKHEDVCYQAKRVVDNFDLLSNYMEFNSPDDVYFVQIIKRWKDNKDKPDAEQWRQQGRQKGSYNSGGEFLNYYLIHSPAELAAIKNEILKVCSYNNARAYISMNSRSQSMVNNFIGKFRSKYSPNDPRYKNAEAILYGQAKSGLAWKNERFKVLLDIDTARDTKTKMPNGKTVNVWDEVKKRAADFGIKVAAEYETPSGGLHMILNNKNNRNLKPFYKTLKDFDGGRDLGRLSTVHPSEDIKMVLYSNVDTEGY